MFVIGETSKPEKLVNNANLSRIMQLLDIESQVKIHRRIIGGGLIIKTILITSITSAILVSTACHLLGSPSATTGPAWVPAGPVPFITWLLEVQTWLGVTGGGLGFS